MHATREQMDMLDRLKRRSDFLAVRDAERKWVSTTMVVQVAQGVESQGGEACDGKPAREREACVASERFCQRQMAKRHDGRFGLTVTKKTFKSAVRRNRIRRRLRAVAYEVLPQFALNGADIVLIGRAATLEADYAALCRDLDWCLRRLGLEKK